MAIDSETFGRVSLTEADAEKFIKQVAYGRPKAAAHLTAKRGVELSREFQRGGGKVLLKSR